VLDVLQLDPAGAPEEERVRIRRVDDVGDVEPATTRFLNVLVDRLDQESEMVEKRSLGLARIARLEVDVRFTGPQAAALDGETERRQLGEGRVRIRDAEGHVVDVVGRAVRFDGHERHTGRRARELLTGASWHSDRDVRQDAPIAGTVGRKEGELAAPGVRSDERERVRALDHVHAQPFGEEIGEGIPVLDPESDVVERLDTHTTSSTHHPCFERGASGKNSTVQRNGRRVLVLAARQPGLVSELEAAGFAVDSRRQPLADDEGLAADVAIVFRGRLIGRNQAHLLAEHGIPVIEVHTAAPQTSSTSNWIRISNRIAKSDLVQIARALADWAENGGSAA
jgi:hypothetical protein